MYRNSNRRNGLPSLDTSVQSRSTTEGKASAIVQLGGIGDHIEKLKQVSLGTQKLANLLADQLQGLSGTVPVFHGFEIVKELRVRSKERSDGIQDAFKQLRAHIEREKSLFYTRNSGAIERLIRERVEKGVERKLPIVLRERLDRYKEYLRTNNVLTDKVKQVMATTSARDANSTLSPDYPDEEVTLILPHPDWIGLTLGNLRNIGGPAIAKLAKDQDLTPSDGSPDSELARIHNLNIILKHLGVPYRAVPSWNGILFTSLTRRRNH